MPQFLLTCTLLPFYTQSPLAGAPPPSPAPELPHPATVYRVITACYRHVEGGGGGDVLLAHALGKERAFGDCLVCRPFAAQAQEV
ncbi:UNVERIFIED_CONTAM: hypothetical protein Sradi_2314100 [Sesamum radiatum]|uniref:Secreted protein n=1 Tax=Sesamum radiatum TaxID=300843 RepID=A0AAW2T6B3_SESRA